MLQPETALHPSSCSSLLATSCRALGIRLPQSCAAPIPFHVYVSFALPSVPKRVACMSHICLVVLLPPPPVLPQGFPEKKSKLVVDVETNPMIHAALDALKNKTVQVEKVNIQMPAIDLSKHLPAGHDVVSAQSCCQGVVSVFLSQDRYYDVLGVSCLTSRLCKGLASMLTVNPSKHLPADHDAVSELQLGYQLRLALVLNTVVGMPCINPCWFGSRPGLVALVHFCLLANACSPQYHSRTPCCRAVLCRAVRRWLRCSPCSSLPTCQHTCQQPAPTLRSA